MRANNRLHGNPLNRRAFVRLIGAAGAGAAISPLLGGAATNPAASSRRMVRFPDKTELILLTDRPPQLETPLHYFREDFTPNQAFFVRWHIEGIPTSVDLDSFRLEIGGHVQKPLSLSLADLRREFTPVSLNAVNQCSGNSRGLFQPRVPGGQWQNGAMGNARWTGVPLRDLLNRAGVKPGAVDVGLSGLDRPPLAATPSFAKAIAIDHALDGEVMVAYEMNGERLPMLNGFPLRLVVPGWYATYWVKSLHHITVLAEAFHGFWMDKAYRIPATPNANESPSHPATETIPINRMCLRSLFVQPEPDEQIPRQTLYEIQGLALDGGHGIQRVEVSTDGGATWQPARLDPDLGKYSWRRWRFAWRPAVSGRYRLKVRAFNRAGERQTTSVWNRGGYMRNVIEQTDVEVV